jgi:hypothetical protein
MSKSIRVRTTPNQAPSYLKVKLEQDFDFIEILSLKISQAEAYARFCSDYGVVVGRVIVNDGFGVPNAKVSVFVPISDDDKENSEILGSYPFENIDDKTEDGVRYNLLKKNGDPYDGCYTPVGTFPSKRDIIDNDTTLEIYDKYYKFTTSTNESGDFMLFGVPTGPQVVNVDVDMSDIGIASQRPYDLISQGDDIKKFQSPTKFRGDKDLDKLLQIKSFKKGINVQPFWGDNDQCDVGITRLDVDLKQRVIPSAIFIGSLFSDSEKNSVNKQCRPRKDFGRLCETETGEGTIEMIRKNIDGSVERFDVEGGRVIDEFGAWAYQVPMNLDYMITDEFGNLVPSDDPNKGIATKARVRFRISKDITGSDGRMRTTAKYLVPHNPANSSEIDYNFDENTSDVHFRDFHWNKIYTVTNFIPRVQPICAGDKCADNRNITGIKDVDNCSGIKTPFPYNRVDTDFNPLFLIICIILSIVIFIVWMINSLVISLINIVIYLINQILELICKIVFGFAKTVCGLIGALSLGTFDSDNCKKKGCIGVYDNGDCDCNTILKYIPCIVLECDEKHWAPGCDCSDSDALNSPVGDTDPETSPSGNVNIGSLGCWAATTNSNSPKNILHWSGLAFTNSNCGHSGHNTIGAGVADCYAIQLADALNMFEFDFYNDWINGTLYSYLLKYKKKKNGKRKFCDSECDSSDSDNSCDKSWFVDTCRVDDDSRDSIKFVTKKAINEGFVKIVTKKLPTGVELEDLYYSPYSVDANAKLFATDLVHLGSVFDCDWQGIPKIQPYLVPTTYKRPPYTSEYKDDDVTQIACGMTSTGINGSGGLFFDIDCIGLTVGQINAGGSIGTASRCNNLKRICEHGVNIDEAEFDANGNVVTSSNCYINGNDIIQPWGDLFRDVFAQLNMNDGPTKLNSWPISGLPNAFDTSLGTGKNAGGAEYLRFRSGTDTYSNAYNTQNYIGTNDYRQPKNSFYFYFGTAPNRTAVELLNRKYFTECQVVIKNDFIVSGIITDSTGSNTCNGSINTTVVGGVGPYTYNWTGPNGFTLTETVGDIINLCSGNYNLTVTDSNGDTSTITFTVNAPSSISCIVGTNNAINAGGNGDLIINVFGGTSPFTYTINGGSPVTMSSPSMTIPTPAGTYTVVVTDSNGDSCTSTATITQPPLLTLGSQVTWNHTTCGLDNGTITINNPSQAFIGGIPPYSFNITGPSFSSQFTNVGSLASGTYTVTVTDSSSTPQVDSQTVTINPSVQATIAYVPEWYCWIYPNVPQIYPSFMVSSNGGFTIEAVPRDNSTNNPTTPILSQTYGAGMTNVTFPLLTANRYDFYLTDSNGCTAYEFADFRVGGGHVPNNPIRMVLANPMEKYCWISGSNKQILPQFQIWNEGPFTIKQGATVLYTSTTGVPAGTTISLTTIVTVPITNITTITLVDTNHPTCTFDLTINFTSQVPSSALNAVATQPTNGPCSATNGTVNCAASGGWAGYTYLWYRNGVSTGITTQTATVTPIDCGSKWQCRVIDTEGCVKLSNIITIS